MWGSFGCVWVHLSLEMLLAERCSQPWCCADAGFPGCGGEPSQQAVQGAMELAPTKLASHCKWQTVLESS